MIQIGNIVVNTENFESINLNQIHKQLSKQNSKDLANIIIDLSEQLYNLQNTNVMLHKEMMTNMTSIGGITINK